MSHSITKKVGIATLIMMVSIFLSRVIGMLRTAAIAYIGGQSASVDAYQVSFVLPEILNHAVASGFLSITFIPLFSSFLLKGCRDEGYQLLSTIVSVIGSLLVVGLVIAICCTSQLVSLLAPGLTDPETFSLAVKMTRIIIPAQFFFFVGGLFTAVQYAQGKFTIPALAPIIYNTGIIFGGILLNRWWGMTGFSWGVLIGAFLGNFLLQFWGASRLGMKLGWRFDFRHPDLKKYVLLTLPLMVGFTMLFGVELFLRIFGTYLPAGNLAGLTYALRIMLMLAAFFGQAVGIASYPYMAQLVAENKIQQLNRLLNDTLRYLALVIPFAVLLFILRKEVVMLLLQRGRFDREATEFTAHVLSYLLIGAYAFTAQTVVARVYYAMQNTLLPAIFSTIAVTASIPLYWYGLKLMGATGIALAISISGLFQVWLLYVVWNRKHQNRGSRAVFGFIAKILLFSSVLGGAIFWIKEWLWVGSPTGLAGNMMSVVITSTVFCALFLVLGHLLGIKEIDAFARRFIWRHIVKKA